MHSRENPINSSNQVIDSISPSGWSPNRSQEKGFPEAASVSRNGQMSFFVRGQRRPDLSRARNEAQCQNQQHGLCVGLSTLKLPCNHSTLQYFPHFFSVLRKQKREEKVWILKFWILTGVSMPAYHILRSRKWWSMYLIKIQFVTLPLAYDTVKGSKDCYITRGV